MLGVSISDPDLVRRVLVKDFHVFQNRHGLGNVFDDVMSKFLSFLRGDEWKRVRTILTPTFTSNKMRRMFHCMNQTADEAVEALEKVARNQQEVDLKKFAGRYTLDVIAACCFATRPKSHENTGNDFLKHADLIFKPSLKTVLVLMATPRFFARVMLRNVIPNMHVRYFKEAVEHLLEQRRRTGARGNDFLQLLIDAQSSAAGNEITEQTEQTEQKSENEADKEAHHIHEHNEDGKKANELFDNTRLQKKTLDDNEVIGNAVLFLAAGYETTATLISFALYRLAYESEVKVARTHVPTNSLLQVQERLRKELVAAGDINYEMISTNAYLDAVISETLRFYPPAAALTRQAEEDYKLPGTDVVLPKGCLVEIPAYAIHHDPDNYPNPEKFEPERFLPENRDKLKPYTYLPFGAGPRNCIGMRFALLEAKLLLAKLILKFRFYHTKNTDFPPQFKPSPGLLTFKPLVIGCEVR